MQMLLTPRCRPGLQMQIQDYIRVPNSLYLSSRIQTVTQGDEDIEQDFTSQAHMHCNFANQKTGLANWLA